jgi:hypothetical protein
MLPLIYEMWVLTYYSTEYRTVLFTEQVYLDKLKAQKAAWYQNSKHSPRPATAPRISVMTVEEYAKTREREAEHIGEIRGQFPERY